MSETSEVLGVFHGEQSLLDFTQWAEAFPEGTVVHHGRFGMEARTPGTICGCFSCDQRDRGAIADLTGRWSIRLAGLMILCPDCGNKRCPKAAHHDNTCTGSNDPGQPGSRYPAAPVPHVGAGMEGS